MYKSYALFQEPDEMFYLVKNLLLSASFFISNFFTSLTKRRNKNHFIDFNAKYVYI